MTMKRFEFSQLSPQHLELLHQWLNEPHVAERWDGCVSVEDVWQRYFGSDRESHIDGFLASLNGSPIGFIQSYWATQCGDGWWEQERDPGTVGIDFFIGHRDKLGQGVGTKMIRQFADTLFANPAVTKIISDPAPDNLRSIRCLEKAGFQRIGEIDTPSGAAILMQALRHQLSSTTSS
ncbi:MAG TPA: GNAT family N-acetyltransferase [Oculatellaceae cyanobacterium]